MANALNLLLQGFAAAPSSSSALTNNDQAPQANSSTADTSDSLAQSATGEVADGDFAAVLQSQATDASEAKATAPGSETSASALSVDPGLFFHAPDLLIGDQQAYALLPEAGKGLPLWGQQLPSSHVLAGVAGEQPLQLGGTATLGSSYNEAENSGANPAAQSLAHLDQIKGLELGPDGSAAGFEEDPIFSGLSFLPKPTASTATTERPAVLDDLELSRQAEISSLDASMLKQQAANRYNSALQTAGANEEHAGHVAPMALQGRQNGQIRQAGLPEYSAVTAAGSDDVQDSPLGLERLMRSEVAVLQASQTNTTASVLDAVTNGVDSNSSSTQSAVQGFAARLDASFRESLDLSASKFEQARVSVPFNQPGWGENLGKQLNLLVARNMDAAQIQLDPPELGPLQVRIQVQNDQVTLQFTSQHATVRDALEQSVARLQEMFAEEGMDLVDVNVSDQGSGDEGQQAHADGQIEDVSMSESDENLTQPLTMAVADGKIDYFI